MNMLSRSPTSKITYLGNIMHMDAFTHNAYIEEFTEYQDFKDVFQQ
jgi:hypothetical protein